MIAVGKDKRDGKWYVIDISGPKAEHINGPFRFERLAILWARILRLLGYQLVNKTAAATIHLIKWPSMFIGHDDEDRRRHLSFEDQRLNIKMGRYFAVILW